MVDSIYLDHAGTTLPPKSLMDAFAAELTSNLYGNPHSASSSSQATSSRIDDTRLRLLNFLNAEPAEYDLIFVSNATAGIKLVVEALRSTPGGFRFAYHDACHTSAVGIREEATQTTCFDDSQVNQWMEGNSSFTPITAETSTTLFAYSAQSHLDGRRYPLSWPQQIRSQQHLNCVYSLVDASSLAATSPLDIGNIAADFTVLSLYKIFGFPDLGALIVRRSSGHIFQQRKYFGGGTVDMVVCGKEQWHARKSTLHSHLEDGTLPFHSIIAAGLALETHKQLFGSMEQVSSHTRFLAATLLNGLSQIRHSNGSPVCYIYTRHPDESRLGTGPVISFNLRNSAGSWVGLAEFEKLAILRNIQIRTGSVCSPGGIASLLNLLPWEMRKNFSAGVRCGADSEILNGKPTGVIRASLGAMSTKSDVDSFVGFIQEFFVETSPFITPSLTAAIPSTLRLKSIIVYPIKSCGGYFVPRNTPWAIKPEGLAWDREWCLVHRGSGQALSQKRYPKMALFKPRLDFKTGQLHISFTQSSHSSSSISIPLSANPGLFTTDFKQTPSRVCGDPITAQVYASSIINDFFSDALGVPCALARFPPGGSGLTGRLSKLSSERQHGHQRRLLPGSFPDDIPSPPDSDSEQRQKLPETKLLLSNESPILMIHEASVAALNEDIVSRGGTPVSSASFRANVLLENADEENQQAWTEDSWRQLRIGSQNFTLLGKCRRCQMVCVDQVTAEKKQEPFVTLAKTRRIDGKVYFGMHMQHEVTGSAGDEPTVTIGDSASVLQ